jgi:hypothetical protein
MVNNRQWYNAYKMKVRKKFKFSWATFGVTLGICLTIGFPIVSYNSILPLEFRNNSITLVSVSLISSILFGYWRFIWNTLSRLWIPIAKWVAWEYIEKRMKEYSSEIRILGLKNSSGTVNLILEAGVNDGVSLGMTLDVVTQPGGEKYGEVQVIQLSNGGCIVLPTNRINIEFWEKLEDRMKSDPSPPANVAARLQMPEGLVDLLKFLR